MNRWDIINKYIKENNYKDYLEIGLSGGSCFNMINIQNKESVECDKNAETPTYFMTSDNFFKQNQKTYDIIFIDGLHHADQVLRDIENSLKILNPKGTILCHDMKPPYELAQKVPRVNAEWTGDCWKAYAYLKGKRKDLTMYIYNDDYGVGVIKKGEQKPVKELQISIEKMDWNFYLNYNKFFDYRNIA